MRGPNLELKSRISAKISARSPQTIWTPSDFADLGPRDAVDKAQPLWRRATLGGSAWAFTTGNVSIRSPTKRGIADYRAVTDTIARRDKTRILVDGMTADIEAQRNVRS